MCCTTLIAQQSMMATTQLTRAAGHEISWPVQERTTEYRPVRVNWVVAIDETGNRRLRMSWGTDLDIEPIRIK